jgi:hypothetical protein
LKHSCIRRTRVRASSRVVMGVSSLAEGGAYE